MQSRLRARRRWQDASSGILPQRVDLLQLWLAVFLLGAAVTAFTAAPRLVGGHRSATPANPWVEECIATARADSEPSARRWALEEIALAGAEEHVELLLGVLRDDPDPAVRAAAARIIGALPAEASEHVLTELLRAVERDDALLVREAASHAAAQPPFDRLDAMVSSRLESGDASVRTRLIGLLGQLASPQRRERRVYYVAWPPDPTPRREREPVPPEVQSAAALVIADLAVHDADANVRDAAVCELEVIVLRDLDRGGVGARTALAALRSLGIEKPRWETGHARWDSVRFDYR